jgi:RNA exonuclease 1
LVLSPSDLRDNDFPLETSPGYVTLRDDIESSHAGKLVAVDCEMCITEQGFELTRVTLVDEDGNCIYDKYVKPHNEIVNYNTRYSGITKEMLEAVETRLEDVQRELQQLLSATTILVGHSLENDLRALKIVHKRVTSTWPLVI